MSDTNSCDNALGSSSTVQQRVYEGAIQREKELRTMHKRMMVLAFCIVAFAMSAAAQNTFPASGYVGIGTTSPNQALTVTNNNLGLEVQNSGPGGGDWVLYSTKTGDSAPAGEFTIRQQGLAASASSIVLNSNGNVGIGTTAPAYKLDVAGQIRSSSGGIVFPDGSTQLTAFNPTICGGDYAESVDVTGARTSYEPGDVLVLDMENPGKVLKSIESYSTSVSGIYSTKPGTVGRRQTTAKSPDEVPMAMMGIVPTKVSAENGPVKVGDLLVSSSKAGYAMKGTDRDRMLGAVIGKAMGKLDSGTGVIEVLVTLQ